jgi:hypothetical protein
MPINLSEATSLVLDPEPNYRLLLLGSAFGAATNNPLALETYLCLDLGIR